MLEVQQRWRSLREAYNKHKKEVEFSDGSKAVKHWEFFEDMKFIEPHIMHRKYVQKKRPISYCFANINYFTYLDLRY